MTTPRRTYPLPQNLQITEKALALWLTVREICYEEKTEDWEWAGGRRREYLDTESKLMLLLGFPYTDPGIWTPSQAAGYPDKPPPWLKKDHQLELFYRGRALFNLLEAARERSTLT
jgi:hypothetical protein